VAACNQCGTENPAGFRFCGTCGAALTGAPEQRELRKTVTVVFCDLTGSTTIAESHDPELVRRLLSDYFERMRTIIERHGGQVEKYIGDAVVAVFGVPVLHEDDALRAVRAAVEMRDALPGLGLAGRIGVTTGMVVTGSDQALATGDAMNVAARLQQAAQPGEVLVGAPTVAFVEGAAMIEPIEPLTLKGKANAVEAYRLLDVGPAPERRHAMHFVGRETELAVLRNAWTRTEAERRCELVTIVGEAGAGKSRLVAEFLESTDALTLHGRCLPYGEGITYWPVVEVLKQLGTVPDDAAIAAQINALLGKTTAATSSDELAWAFRKTLEHAAATRPVVAVFDDIQWGEQTFLDLVEHVVLMSADAAILLVCMARPELVDHRPAWPVTLRLGGLSDTDVDQLLPPEMADDLRRRIRHAAGGNPLFVEEIVTVTAEEGSAVEVPATLRALLGARLDQLDMAERSILGSAAVEGEVFHRGAVQALTPQGTPVMPQLARLVRRQLIQPERPVIAGDDGFRFRHLLIRDAAYDALPKSERADLHVRLAKWLQDRGADIVEQDELIGYHLEQSLRYQADLGLPRDETLADAVFRHLQLAAQRADVRGDTGATVSLLSRAVAALPSSRIDLSAEGDLIDALLWDGQPDKAVERAEYLIRRGHQNGDEIAELCGQIKADNVRLFVEFEGIADRLEAEIEHSLPVFNAAGNHAALDIACFTLTWVKQARGRMDEALQAAEQAARYRPERAVDLQIWRAGARLDGPTPAAELVAWLEEPEQRAPRSVWLDVDHACGLAMLGRFNEARTLIAATRAALVDRGSQLELGNCIGEMAAEIELLAGEPEAAAALAAEGCDLLEAHGDRYFRAPIAGRLGQILATIGRLDEANDAIELTKQLTTEDDTQPRYRWMQAKAVVLARTGHHLDAEELAGQAIAIADTTDLLNDQADAYQTLATVLMLAGSLRPAANAMRESLDRYTRKGNLVMMERLSERLART
jgi:class 3 adenylate cyclase/tetratricopeptide (TPR) repeat protein